MRTAFFNGLVISCLFLLASCGKSNTVGKLIPSNADMVIHINGKSLSGKLSWSEIKQNAFFINAYGDSSLAASMKALLNNPEGAGIDANGDLLFFVQKDTIGNYGAFEGTIKDEKLFKAFNAQFFMNATETEKDGVKYITKNPYCLGYSKDKFVYIVDAPELNKMQALNRRKQASSSDSNAIKHSNIEEDCKAIFTLKESNSLGKSDKFSNLLNETGDLHLWINLEQLAKGIPANPMMAMVNTDQLYKGSIATAAFNFEKGKINILAKTYLSDDLASIFKKYKGANSNEDMMKRMPGKDIVGLMAFSFKPEGIREFLQLTNLDGFANMGLKYIGFTIDDFIKANKGDVFIGVSDLTVKTDSTKQHFKLQDEVVTENIKPVFNFVFATTIADKNAFTKLVDAGKKLGTQHFADSSKLGYAYNLNNTYFALANTKENANKFIAGTNTNFDFISKINGQPMAGYLNIQLLLKAFEKQSAKDSSEKKVYNASVKLWDNILLKAGDMAGSAITQTIEINLIDKTTNSLKQLTQYANVLSEVNKIAKDKQKADRMAFEDALPPELKEPTPKTK